MEFISALETLRSEPPPVIVKKLIQFYAYIGKMEENELISSYQALRHLARSLDAIDNPDIQELFGAMEAQMVNLINAPYLGFSQKHRVQVRFEAVVGKVLYNHVFGLDSILGNRNRR